MTTQAMAALSVANETRKARGDLKLAVCNGELPIQTLILSNPDILRTRSSHSKPISIEEILSWQKGWGRKRAKRFCREHGFPPGAELHALSEGRRRLLSHRLH